MSSNHIIQVRFYQLENDQNNDDFFDQLSSNITVANAFLRLFKDKKIRDSFLKHFYFLLCTNGIITN